MIISIYGGRYIRSRKSVTVVIQSRLFSNRPVNLRINCPTIRRSTRVPTYIQYTVFEPCPGIFVSCSLSPWRVYVCMCSKQRDTRQIMASHHGRENCLMKNVRPIETLDNKVEREENRDLVILSLKILILFICVFTQRFNLPTFNTHCVDDDPRHF